MALPGATFANDSAVMDGALYVSDNRTDQIFKIEPADFLNMKGESIGLLDGLYEMADGSDSALTWPLTPSA